MVKSKNSNKAFTLIELLGVIILLSVIAIIALIAVNKNIKDTQKTLKQVQLNNIKDGAKNWATDNIKSIPDGKTIYLTLAQLKQGGYVEENIKSPGNDKLCFPNDLQIEIISNNTGSYQYNVLDDKITYISCEDDLLDSNAPHIVLSPGDEINGKNEIVDYVEVSQSASYTVPRAMAYDNNGDFFTGKFTASVDGVAGSPTYTGTIDYIVLDNIKTVGQIYKITYTIEYDNKTVSAVRNVIIRDTTAPEITITSSEDNVLYYYDTNNSLKFISYAFTSNNFEVTDNSGSVEKVTVEGEREINSYFSSLSNISNYSPKEFQVVVNVADSSGNSKKVSQYIKLNLIKATGPIIKLYNGSKNATYYEKYSDDASLNRNYDGGWITDEMMILKIGSGCPIDKSNSYYEYDGTRKQFNEFNIGLYDIEIPIDTIEGRHNFEVYAKCSEQGLDRTIFPNIENIEVEMDPTELKVDLAAPDCSITLDKEPDGSNGWYKVKPTVTLKIEDSNEISEGKLNGSNLTFTNKKKYESNQILDDGIYTYTLNGTDAADRTCTATKTIKIDTIDPQIASSSSVPEAHNYSITMSGTVTRNTSSGVRATTDSACTTKCSTGSTDYTKCKNCSSSSSYFNPILFIKNIATVSGTSVSNISFSNVSRNSNDYLFRIGSSSSYMLSDLNFSTNKTFDQIAIYFGYGSGWGTCSKYAVDSFYLDNNPKSSSNGTYVSYVYKMGTNGCGNKLYIANDPLYFNASGASDIKFTVNFTDSGSGLNITSKTCIASSGGTCQVSTSDNAGNSKVVTCSYSLGTCS